MKNARMPRFSSGWFAGAWSGERPWTWWALLVLQCAGVLIAPATVRVVGAVVGLVLLPHPDSRARIDRGVPPPERTVG